jgi:uncharacterized protein YqeY
MHTTYHFKSAEDINLDTINNIKKAFKTNAIVVTVDDELVVNIPEEQKKFVRDSIKKYKENPELLIDEAEAWKIINAV